MRFNPNSRGGFSLVELMVVIAILAILAVVTAPALNKFIPKYRVEGAAKVLATEMQLARMQAVAKNLRHRLTFNDTAQTVTVAIQTTDDDDGTVPDATAFDAPYRTIQFGETGVHHPKVILGRNTTVNGDPATAPEVLAKTALAGTSSYTFSDADGNPTITFLPNGRTDQSGFFFLMPTGDENNGKVEHIRAVEIIRAGMIQKYRYTADKVWKEY